MSKVYKYISQQPLFAHAWSYREDKPYRIAVCSCSDEGRNSIELLKLRKTQEIAKLDAAIQQFPITKIQFLPSLNTNNPDMFITSSDCLRMYSIRPENNQDKINATGFLRCEKRKPSPVLSFDWSPLEMNIVASSTYDTLVSIWDLQKECLDMQFSGHERAVNDICFSSEDPNVFITCSSDGCLRLFDRRHMEYSNELYDSEKELLRCEYNKIDSNYIGFVENDKKDLVVLDIRNTGQPIFLKKHDKPINGFEWSPGQPNILLTCSEDGNCYIWDITKDKQGKPTMGYNCNVPIASCGWSSLDKEWCSVVHDNTLEALHI